mgnify:CR=1 FL=1
MKRARAVFTVLRGRHVMWAASVFVGTIVVLALLLPRTGSSESVGSHSPLQGWRIVVDAGHGGEDRGVCYFPDALIEKEINLDMANRLGAALAAAGAEIFYTRTDDVFVSLEDRAEHANAVQADLFISLHVNRIPNHPECFGAQTFYYPTSEASKAFAEFIQAELLRVDPENYRQIQSGNYKVLRLTNMPAVIVEIAFMTNERDRRLLQDDAYRDAITQAIVAGVIGYVESTSRSAE